MERKPRNPKENIFNSRILLKSGLQGIMIFAASFGAYYAILAQNPNAAPQARTTGLVVIILANLFLVQVNSSDRDLMVRSAKRLAKDKVMWAVNIGTIAGTLLLLYTPLHELFKFAPLTLGQFFTALGIAAASVLWYELVKLVLVKLQS